MHLVTLNARCCAGHCRVTSAPSCTADSSTVVGDSLGHCWSRQDLAGRSTGPQQRGAPQGTTLAGVESVPWWQTSGVGVLAGVLATGLITLLIEGLRQRHETRRVFIQEKIHLYAELSALMQTGIDAAEWLAEHDVTEPGVAEAFDARVEGVHAARRRYDEIRYRAPFLLGAGVARTLVPFDPMGDLAGTKAMMTRFIRAARKDIGADR
jgi:hypothetical protein